MDELLKLDENCVVAADPKQVSCEVDNEVVILHLTNGIYYGLNQVGARIWSLVQQPITIRQILEVLLAEYEVEPEVCQRDLLGVLGELANHGLIEIQDEMVQ